MPDISMCKNEECSKKLQCYRFTAEVKGYQQYIGFFEDGYGKCEYFINNKKKVEVDVK